MKKSILVAVVIICLTSKTCDAQTNPVPAGPPSPFPTSYHSAELLPPPGPPVPVDGQNTAPLQTPPAFAPPSVPPVHPGGPIVPPTPPLDFAPCPSDVHNCGWATVDFLLWSIKPGPSPNPLVTTGPATDTLPGSLGPNGPNTVVLFGEHNLDYDTFSGGRFTLGFWLPQCPLIGFEGSFFALQSRSVRFGAASDANGDQIIARPVIITPGASETAYIDTAPGSASGGISVSSTSQLYSFEFNMDANMLRTSRFQWDLTAGFRFLSLREDLEIDDYIVPLSNAAGFTFQGAPVGPPSILSDYDRFRTSNQFYGGQIGSRINWFAGRFDVNLTAKVALGATHQLIQIDGASYLLTPGSDPVTAQGGILAQQTNIGRYSRNVFTVAPEGDLNFGYAITPWCRAQVGYTFLYWSDVVRPGNQIDRTVNTAVVPTDPSYTGGPAVPARPMFAPQTTDFWAQGINFGLEIRF